ncbi:hypothetical protein F8M41_011985 [Gigaspora margarita]|uniref:Uncharacterized protein n=1 Tax=Gigaspora margarita TaxID=4874 RepID=A0A8H3WYI5_GIGMA|nr:hypothetical protein F8M41_011985 [Gigaspora margarita]
MAGTLQQIHPSTIRFHLSTIKFHPYTVRFRPFELHSTVSQVPLEGFQVPPEGFQVSPEVSIKLHLSPSSFTHPIKLRPSTVKLRPSTSEFHPRAPLNSFASSPPLLPKFHPKDSSSTRRVASST